MLSSELFVHRCRWIDGGTTLLVLGTPCVMLFSPSQKLLLGCVSLGFLCASTLAGVLTAYYLRKMMGIAFFEKKEIRSSVALLFRFGIIIIPAVLLMLFCWREISKLEFINFWALDLVVTSFLVSFSAVYLLFPILNYVSWKLPKKEISGDKESQIRELFGSCGYNKVEIFGVNDEKIRYKFCSAYVRKGVLRVMISDGLLNRLSLEELKSLVLRQNVFVSRNRLLDAGVLGTAISAASVFLSGVRTHFESQAAFLMPLGLLIEFIIIRMAYRKICFRTDRKAVELGVKPAALIGALEKEAEMNFVPRNRMNPIFSPGNGLPTIEERKKRLVA